MIGHIERLMIDKVTGKVSYAILSFGGFLGIGANLIPLPWGRLRYNTRFEAYELDIDDEELRRAPSFRADKDFDWGDRAKEAELHRYYGMTDCVVEGTLRAFGVRSNRKLIIRSEDGYLQFVAVVAALRECERSLSVDYLTSLSEDAQKSKYVECAAGLVSAKIY